MAPPVAVAVVGRKLSAKRAKYGGMYVITDCSADTRHATKDPLLSLSHAERGVHALHRWMDRSLTLSPFSVLCCCPVVLSFSRSLSMQHSRSFPRPLISHVSLSLPPHCIFVTSQSQRRQQQHDGEDDFPPTFGPDCLGRLRDGGRTDGRAGGRRRFLFSPPPTPPTLPSSSSVSSPWYYL